jgi:CBS domain containing-hemolysin-like protein
MHNQNASPKDSPNSNKKEQSPAPKTQAERVLSDDQDGEGFFYKMLNSVGLKPSISNLRSELEDALDADERLQAVFSPEERVMLRNILTMREIKLSDVMIPRADIIALDALTPLGEVLKQFKESGHSRMPVYEDTLDAPIGMVHIKDVMSFMTAASEMTKDTSQKKSKAKPSEDADFPCHLNLQQVDLGQSLQSLHIIRRVLFVPPSMPASDLLATMQAQRTQMALVIDEYGGTDGLVSLEDIVEIVMGDIEDEHDEEEASMLTPLKDGIVIADARASLDDLIQMLEGDFDSGEQSEDVDTLGGLIYTLLDRIPTRGELITSIKGYEIEILEADPRRIRRIKITPIQAASPALS